MSLHNLHPYSRSLADWCEIDWAFDYWMLSHNLGHKHYMVRNDTLTTYPPTKWHEVR